MRIALTVLFLALLVPAFAQSPIAGYVYEDRAGTTGHTIVENGKSFGPYKDIVRMVYSTHGKAGLFIVNKRDKNYVLIQGKETGPFAPGFENDSIWLADDGKFWAVSLSKYTPGSGDEEESDYGTSELQLMVNGKLYGPYLAIDILDYSETGGNWIASVQTAEDRYAVLVNGKLQGEFQSVTSVWMSADGKIWGFYAFKDEENSLVVTQDQTYSAIQNANFYSMNLREPHWAYSIRTGDDDELIVVDGKSLPGYLNFQGLTLTPSGRHWGFAAEKLTDAGDYPVVVIDGTEFVGEGLSSYRLGNAEGFTWNVREGNKTTVQVLEVKN